MNENTVKEIYHILPNGKCPNCKVMIRGTDSEGEFYKTRLLKKIKKYGELVKCPNCKKMIII